MPAPSKFTAEVRRKILEVLAVGGSLRTAAAVAGIDHKTLSRWLDRGKEGGDGGRWAEFYTQVQAAKAAPRVRALGIIYKELPDNPGLAWKFIERTEEGYAPPVPSAPGLGTAPVLIQLSLHDGALPQLGQGQVIEGEVVEELVKEVVEEPVTA